MQGGKREGTSTGSPNHGPSKRKVPLCKGGIRRAKGRGSGLEDKGFCATVSYITRTWEGGGWRVRPKTSTGKYLFSGRQRWATKGEAMRTQNATKVREGYGKEEALISLGKYTGNPRRKKHQKRNTGKFR